MMEFLMVSFSHLLPSKETILQTRNKPQSLMNTPRKTNKPRHLHATQLTTEESNINTDLDKSIGTPRCGYVVTQ